MFAAGAVVLLARKAGHHGWGEFACLLVTLIPALVLYLLALGVLGRPDGKTARPSQSVLAVSAILLWPVVLLQFLAWVGANTDHPLYEAAVFALTGLLAGYAARRARVSFAALLACLSLLVSWLLVWEKILGHSSANTFRWLLLTAAVLLFAVAIKLARASAIGASDVATAGAVAAVSAGVLGVIVGYFVTTTRGITGLIESSGGALSRSTTTIRPRLTQRQPLFSSSQLARHPLLKSRTALRSHALPSRLQNTHLARPHLFPSSFVAHVSGLQHFGWDLYLLVVSLALVWVGSRVRTRGLGYVGGFGVLAFLLSTGAQVTRTEFGWPLALLILGLAGLLAPLISTRKS
jgi:hypothetical protein